MYFTPQTITTLEVEATSYCNSFCGACYRNIEGGPLADYIKLAHMKEDVWLNIISTESLEFIKIINFDGNMGDASMHPRLIEMLEKLNQVRPDIEVRISTNGGARPPQFWGLLAKTLQKFHSHCLTFSVDGLEDTNELYRRGVNWKRLISNIKAFNINGGISRWRCLVFDHNKHQINKIQETAKNMGCSYFVTFRNRQSPIFQRAYKTLPETTLTSPPLDIFKKKYSRFVEFKKTPLDRRRHDSFKDKNYSCPFGEGGKISIDNLGFVWPCCFASVSTSSHLPVEKYRSNCNIQKNSLKQILNFFKSDLYSSWNSEPYLVCQRCLHKTNPPTYPAIQT